MVTPQKANRWQKAGRLKTHSYQWQTDIFHPYRTSYCYHRLDVEKYLFTKWNTYKFCFVKTPNTEQLTGEYTLKYPLSWLWLY